MTFTIVADSTQNISQILPPPHILQSAQQMGQPSMNHHGAAPPNENAPQQQPIPNPNPSTGPMAGPYNHHPPMQNQMPPPGSIHVSQQPQQQQSAQVTIKNPKQQYSIFIKLCIILSS